jgi:hypothetical protein
MKKNSRTLLWPISFAFFFLSTPKEQDRWITSARKKNRDNAGALTHVRGSGGREVNNLKTNRRRKRGIVSSDVLKGERRLPTCDGREEQGDVLTFSPSRRWRPDAARSLPRSRFCRVKTREEKKNPRSWSRWRTAKNKPQITDASVPRKKLRNVGWQHGLQIRICAKQKSWLGKGNN